MSVGNATPFMGYDSAFGVAKETTFGTFVTATGWIEFNSEAFKQTREELMLESINTTRDYTKRLIGSETIEGSIEADLNVASDGIVNIIKQAFGGTVSSAANTTASADMWTHTMNLGNMEDNANTSTASAMKGLSVTVRKGNTNLWGFAGVRVNTLTIKAEVGQPVKVSAECIGKTVSLLTTTTAIALTDVAPVNFVGVAINTGDSITGSLSAEYFQSFELTLTNNLDGDQRSLSGTRNIDILPPARRQVKLKLSQRFDTLTSYNRFIQNTATAFQINMATSQTIGALTGNTTYSMVIKLPRIYFNSNMPEVGDAGVLKMEIEGTAMLDTLTSYVMQAIVYNATQSYA